MPDTMQIKTLAQILADNHINDKTTIDNVQNNPASRSNIHKQQLKQPTEQKLTADFFYDDDCNQRPVLNKPKSSTPSNKRKKYSSNQATIRKQKNKQTVRSQQEGNQTANTKQTTNSTKKHQPKPLDIKSILQTVKQEQTSSTPKQDIDNLTNKLQTALKTDEKRQQEINDIKADGRLRWLAFYYLSTREHSANELRQKLLAKGQDPAKIEQLLTEFAQKGYQSEMRTAVMLIREGIRKGRGRRRIEQDFYQRKIAVPNNIDELIEMTNAESDEFADFIDTNTGEDMVDWLRLAVEARVKKYGNEIPTDNKQKAKQLRFLQYRGFKTDICFEALKHNLQTMNG